VNREGLARSGLAVAKITARAVDPLPGTFAGVLVRLDGEDPQDRTPVDDPAVNPLSSGIPNYNAYSMEVVQRIGYDSFTPDNGVLLAKFKDSLRGNNGGPNSFNSYIWVIDAHPQDINVVDFVKPNGEKVMRTIADYRQLNDALFHAGLNSGSHYEWQDPHNRLHFYVVDLETDHQGILVYTLAARSMDGAGPQIRGVALEPPPHTTVGRTVIPVAFTLTNTGAGFEPDPGAEPDPTLYPDDAAAHLSSDLYRLSVQVGEPGWEARLLNGLAAVEAGASQAVTVYVAAERGAAASATLTLTATSESDPSKTATATISLSR
jgi:hypothetical protein